MFDSRHYEVRQKISLGNKYNVYEDDEQILTSAQKKFKLKEDFRFSDPETDEEVFRVKADSVLDFASAYDIVDRRTDERVGSVRRKPSSSFFVHEYELLDPDGDVVATVSEESLVKAALRRFLTTLIPFAYTIESPAGEHLGDLSGQFSLRDQYTVDLASDDLDPRLAVIATIVIDAIESN